VRRRHRNVPRSQCGEATGKICRLQTALENTRAAGKRIKHRIEWRAVIKKGFEKEGRGPSRGRVQYSYGRLRHFSAALRATSGDQTKALERSEERKRIWGETYHVQVEDLETWQMKLFHAAIEQWCKKRTGSRSTGPVEQKSDGEYGLVAV